ncbi:MAG: hypothetical protein FJ254_10250, partial [Phycisphaerae bacterium]|nr:hypothetical protein [Phycisphaerae bacterium]
MADMADSQDNTTAEVRKPAPEQSEAGLTHDAQGAEGATPHQHATEGEHTSSHGDAQGADDATSNGSVDESVELTDAGDDEPIEPDPEAFDRAVDRIDAQPSVGDLRTPSAGEEGDAELLPIEPVTAPTNLMDDEAQVVGNDDEAQVVGNDDEAHAAAHDEDHTESHDGHDDAAEKSMAAVS